MKRFLYSSYTKFIAVVLFILCFVFGTLIITDGLLEFYNEEQIIYHFEADFSQSQYMAYLINDVEYILYDAYNTTTGFPLNEEKLAEKIQQGLKDYYHNERINYCIKWNDNVFTNCNTTVPEDLIQNEFYYYFSKNGTNIERDTSIINRYFYGWLDEIKEYDKTSTIVISTAVKSDYSAECREMWTRQASIVFNTAKKTFLFAVNALLLLIYLVCVCGKDKDKNRKSLWVDNVWLEVHLAVLCVIAALSFIVIEILLNDYYLLPRYIINATVASLGTVTSAVFIISLLSIIRNIKWKNFVHSSIIARITIWILKILKRCLVLIIKGAKLLYKSFAKKTAIILIAMLLQYTAIIGICGIFLPEGPIWLILAIILFCFASLFIANRVKDFEFVKKGAEEIRMGNLNYKISEIKSEDFKKLAENINEIGSGLEKSVSAQVKAEKLKTELVTNVSHDLKTPLTSIISYTELLSKVEELPQEAKDYVSVIAKKSERLKNLTQDLFDVSKMQSGNEVIVFEKLNAALLIEQSLAENENEINSSELDFCVKTDKELYFSADGRKMSRVIGNLIENAIKYSMKGTRVFITAFDNEGEAVIEIKNTSAEPLNFDTEEIMGRFVRGDKSRTEDGNGLGLAIVKSYVEACLGVFEIKLDGDLFKAIIRFQKMQ